MQQNQSNSATPPSNTPAPRNGERLEKFSWIAGIISAPFTIILSIVAVMLTCTSNKLARESITLSGSANRLSEASMVQARALASQSVRIDSLSEILKELVEHRISLENIVLETRVLNINAGDQISQNSDQIDKLKKLLANSAESNNTLTKVLANLNKQLQAEMIANQPQLSVDNPQFNGTDSHDAYWHFNIINTGVRSGIVKDFDCAVYYRTGLPKDIIKIGGTKISLGDDPMSDKNFVVLNSVFAPILPSRSKDFKLYLDKEKLQKYGDIITILIRYKFVCFDKPTLNSIPFEENIKYKIDKKNGEIIEVSKMEPAELHYVLEKEKLEQ
ncbi:hypothetical protein [Pollutibacter soli]|uniref:hypothetical protein n=1 Tax=Pollutibacter soli TaxID=3034157 RepID=UPI003013C6FC